MNETAPIAKFMAPLGCLDGSRVKRDTSIDGVVDMVVVRRREGKGD